MGLLGFGAKTGWYVFGGASLGLAFLVGFSVCSRDTRIVGFGGV